MFDDPERNATAYFSNIWLYVAWLFFYSALEIGISFYEVMIPSFRKY